MQLEAFKTTGTSPPKGRPRDIRIPIIRSIHHKSLAEAGMAYRAGGTDRFTLAGWLRFSPKGKFKRKESASGPAPGWEMISQDAAPGDTVGLMVVPGKGMAPIMAPEAEPMPHNQLVTLDQGTGTYRPPDWWSPPDISHRRRTPPERSERFNAQVLEISRGEIDGWTSSGLRFQLDQGELTWNTPRGPDGKLAYQPSDEETPGDVALERHYTGKKAAARTGYGPVAGPRDGRTPPAMGADEARDRGAEAGYQFSFGFQIRSDPDGHE